MEILPSSRASGGDGILRIRRFRSRIALRLYGLAAMVMMTGYYFMLPDQLFSDPYSTVLEDRSGELLAAAIASDGQWRFPEIARVPSKYEHALILYEDKNFRSHLGVDLRSLARAVWQNLESGKIISGGSTIPMQVIRLSHRSKSRTIFRKAIEIVMATRLELRYSKDEILAIYASHAPFGGNVVGIEAACWRYFGRDVSELSWADAALLAVLPNAPSLIHPGKNRDRLKRKRDNLLDKLQRHGVIDAVTCSLSKEEPVPEEPQKLPRYATHLLARAAQDGYNGKIIRSTIQATLQRNVERLVEEHHNRLAGNQIFNAAALVIDTHSGNVLAYVGNTREKKKERHSDAVDVVTASRSTGSILKPFLYAAMLDEGKILPKSLLPDIPTMINGFAPRNFSREYDGAVPADEALTRSLNVPAVQMLKTYRYEKFHSLMKGMGMTTLTKPPDHYGLSLILGGAEGTLWDITGLYASMARTLINYSERPGSNRYHRNDFHPLRYTDIPPANGAPPVLDATSWLSAASIYQTLDVLTEVYRPGEESGWRYFNSSRKVAWKTGTSFGFRDGWAIGVTPEFTVGIWVGNADGEGRPGLTGTDAAAPLLFDIFSTLDGKKWFARPAAEMTQITVCSKSGQRDTPLCTETTSQWVVKAGLQSLPCSFHKRIHLARQSDERVNADCESLANSREVVWFVLPAAQEHYFKSRNISYKPLPPFRKDCQVSTPLQQMDLLYPKPNSRIFVPRDLDGKNGQTVFELAHRNSSMNVHWHLDGKYVATTRRRHFLPLNPAAGKHILVLVDDSGESIEEHFEVISNL